jgi:casein kinase 1
VKTFWRRVARLDPILLLSVGTLVDIRPNNVFIGSGMHDQQVYRTHFSLAKVYRDPKSGAHIAPSDRKALIRTARYASLHVRKGTEHARLAN